MLKFYYYPFSFLTLVNISNLLYFEPYLVSTYHSTLVALAQIVLFLQVLKFSSFTFLKEGDFVKGNEKYFWNILIFKIKSSRLINWLFGNCMLKLPLYHGIQSTIPRGRYLVALIWFKRIYILMLSNSCFWLGLGLRTRCTQNQL